MSSPTKSIVCKEVFDDSYPSHEEIVDYATKIGINTETEPHLFPIAAEGLMQPLPIGWSPCLDEKNKAYYYYNKSISKSQWEHPLDNIYRALVIKARKDSQSLSLGDPGEDATYTRDDLPSYEESPLLLKPPQSRKLSPLNPRPKSSDIKELKSESDTKTPERPISAFRRSSLDIANKTTDEGNTNFNMHPRSMESKDSILTGRGAMFLKSSAQKLKNLERDSEETHPTLRGILRENHNDKSEEDDKKSVRFNNETNPDVTFFFSEESDTDNEVKKNEPESIQLEPKPVKSRFTVSPVSLRNDNVTTNMKLLKPNPTDFLKLEQDKISDSEDESPIKKTEFKEGSGESETSDSFITKREPVDIPKKFQKSFVELEDEKLRLEKYKQDWFEEKKMEMEKTLVAEKSEQEEKIKSELKKLRKEMENRCKGTLSEEREILERELAKKKDELRQKLEEEENNYREIAAANFERKRRDLEKVHEEKLLLLNKEMGEKLEKAKDELVVSHNAILDQIKQNHAKVLDELQKDHKAEEEIIRKEHQRLITELKNKVSREVDDKSRTKGNEDERLYEKVRCEKRLLEDKYRCLKDKYLKLKTEVKLSIEKRNRKKEQSLTTTTNTTGSETERSPNSKKDRAHHSPSANRKHSPKHTTDQTKHKTEFKPRQVLIQDLDTSASDRSCKQEDRYNCNDSQREYDSSDMDINPSRHRRKLFSRLKYSTASRSGSLKTKENQPRCYSPVENLRKQLQKLEDLEDQFPQNAHGDTYHLRYPFSDAHKFEGSSELEFFRHRIHLERDSIRMAKESLKNQRSHFKQRQSELKLKHGHSARSTLEQLCQEEKELTDMEVSLHRTRSLLGEKVIRLRHLEQSLQRADQYNKSDEATLSDLSSHSASSGISSTEFADSPGTKGAQFKESSEIIQSLENLNSEIREIWEVLHKQQQSSNISAVLPPLPLIYPELSWPLLAGPAPVPPSIPTLADRLQNYRQHMALANAQSTIVTHDTQGATTTLVEKTKNLRQWLRQTAADQPVAEKTTSQTTL